jgi:hypothetical protein
MARFFHPSSGDLSPGSLRVWVMVGMALVFLGLVALRPVIDTVGLNTRLAVAQQSLISYRGAVLAYCSETANVRDDAVFNQPEFEKPGPKEPSAEEASTNSVAAKEATNLGERLVALKKLDEITFPLGERDLVPANGEDLVWQPQRPEILAVAVSALTSHFREPKLFPSARSERVAVLVVPFLNAKEAEEIQKMVGGLQRTGQKEDSFRADCFFSRSSVDEKFNGWLYLCDL